MKRNSLSDPKPYTPSTKHVRDDFAGLYDRDPKIVRARREQFERWLAATIEESQAPILNALRKAITSSNPLGLPQTQFVAGAYLEEAEKTGGRSEWAMRYAEEARAHRHEREQYNELLKVIRDTLDD